MKNYLDTFSVIAAALLIFAAGCAHQQSPSGGPDDTNGPLPVTTSPVNEAVNVSPAAPIEITFSEWILPTSVKGISIFPKTPFKAKVSGNRIVIKPKIKLRDSTTYHCVITSSLKDLHNNSISKPVSIIFSTGSTLDSGSATGCVNDSRRVELIPNVALFRYPPDSGDSGFGSTPDYLTQTDSNGVFLFGHIKTGIYHLVAYLDKNSDGKLQNSSEEVYLSPDSLITVASGVPAATLLYPSRFDTTRQNIASLIPMSSSMMLGTWKRPFDSLVTPSVPLFTFETIDTPKVTFKAICHIEHNSTRFFLAPDSLLDSVPYRLVLSYKSIFDSTVFSDTLRVMGASQKDTVQPVLIRSSPAKSVPLHTSIELVWSEPVRSSGTLYAADTLGDTVALAADSGVSDTTRLLPPRAFQPGRTYRICILTNNFRDVQGNQLKARDSTDTATIITFTTIQPDSIAVSLSGAAPCLDTSSQRIWIWKLVATANEHSVNDHTNSFRFDSIPCGRGLLTTFIDYNNNGKPDAGNLIPFVAPEPVITFPDTIEARARWDVEGIELSPCDQCERKKRDREQKLIEAREKEEEAASKKNEKK